MVRPRILGEFIKQGYSKGPVEEHITPAVSLHCLSVCFKLDFKNVMIACMGLGPDCISDIVTPHELECGQRSSALSLLVILKSSLTNMEDQE